MLWFHFLPQGCRGVQGREEEVGAQEAPGTGRGRAAAGAQLWAPSVGLSVLIWRRRVVALAPLDSK